MTGAIAAVRGIGATVEIAGPQLIAVMAAAGVPSVVAAAKTA